MLIVDAANVVGSRPDGWWRDRPAAATRLITRLGDAVGEGRLSGSAGHVTVVLEGRACGADLLPPEGVSIIRAAGSGDDTIVEVASAEARAAGSSDPAVIVVTADRALAERVRSVGAALWPPGRLLALLPDR